MAALLDPRAVARFRRNRGARFGLILVVLAMAAALFAPLLSPHDPDMPFKSRTLTTRGVPIGPTWEFPLGADVVGRCELSRLLYGARVSLTVAFAATALIVLVGTFIGLLSGYFGGWTDTVLMRLVDALLSFPFLLVVMTLNKIIDEPDLWVIFVVLAALAWPSMARQIRGKTLQLKELDYVLAARALGASHFRIISRHLLPNVIPLVIVIATSQVAGMIVAESSLSYLGVGVVPPASSWGSMLHQSESLTRAVPRLTLVPGLAILLTVVGFNLLGEALRDAVDPRG
ncbi:MAG: ABC transporter permease [Deltaproteobacteria bacterium]|nr:ABC transporter permease [Deltaproteobacteria bacterium]